MKIINHTHSRRPLIVTHPPSFLPYQNIYHKLYFDEFIRSSIACKLMLLTLLLNRSPKVDSMDRRSVNAVRTAFGLKGDVKAEKGKEVWLDSCCMSIQSST